MRARFMKLLSVVPGIRQVTEMPEFLSSRRRPRVKRMMKALEAAYTLMEGTAWKAEVLAVLRMKLRVCLRRMGMKRWVSLTTALILTSIKAR